MIAHLGDGATLDFWITSRIECSCAATEQSRERVGGPLTQVGSLGEKTTLDDQKRPDIAFCVKYR